MALIKCPECGKEISDKSSVCIHCGFPLKSQLEKECSENICVVNGIPFNFTEIIEDVNNFYKNSSNPSIIEKSNLGLILNRKIRQLTGINDVAGATLASKIISLKSIPESFNSSDFPDPLSFDKTKVCCPRCGSTSITTGARGINWTLGLIGASKTVNRCAKCGHTWQPHL